MLSNKKAMRNLITSKVFERGGLGEKLSPPVFLSKTTKGRLDFRRPFHIPTCEQEESVNHSAEAGRM